MANVQSAVRSRRWVAALGAHEAGALEAAAEWFEEIVAAGDFPAEAPGRLAQVYMEAGRFDEAIEFCRHWTEAAPDQAEAWFMLGPACGNAGDHTAAVAATRQGLERAPGDACGWANLGWGLTRLGDWVGAFEAMYAAAVCDRENPLRRAALGVAWANMQLGGELLGVYDPDVDYGNEADPDFALRMALFWLAVGRHDRADALVPLRLDSVQRELWQRLRGQAEPN